MKQISTQDLMLLHLYDETTQEQKVLLTKEMAQNEALKAEYMELEQTKELFNSKIKSPSATSIRIIMEHSFKTEQLQES